MTVEEKLRDWGEHARKSADAPRVPVERFRRSKLAPILAVAAAAVLVACLAVGVALVPRGRHHSPAEASTAHPITPSSSPTRVVKPAPSGHQNVSYRGLTVTVPAAWPLNAVQCGTPVQNTVWFEDGPIASCSVYPHPQVTVVTFSPVPATQPPQGQPTSIDGVRAWTTTTSSRAHGTTIDVVVPSLQVSVAFTSPSSAMAHALRATLQVGTTLPAPGHDPRAGSPR